jgi:hypothetical protein
MTATELWQILSEVLAGELGSPGLHIEPPRYGAAQGATGLLVVIPSIPERPRQRPTYNNQSCSRDLWRLVLTQYDDTREGALKLTRAADKIADYFPNATVKALPSREDSYAQINIDLAFEVIRNTRIFSHVHDHSVPHSPD